ncbi:hypothetical protein PRZ48_003084 [Zasmidium cellare]|uniref:Alpha/beta hydrolase n=1 Tax=Zasmidium cellare TaxID=395010 RepID=A0ABR0EVA7_ZASCE|nr:hypothetical protein PRZ48_003084 [Zasmidium cellare]
MTASLPFVFRRFAPELASGITTLGNPASGAAPDLGALVGLNGLYDLPDLVYGLGTSREHLSGVYKDLLAHAFGSEEGQWPIASPARIHPTQLQERLQRREVSKLVLLDQSAEDQLVPLNQADKMEAALKQADGLLVVRGNRCKGTHAAPWEEGEIIWNTIQDVLALLAK